jgi:hypothetical protein
MSSPAQSEASSGSVLSGTGGSMLGHPTLLFGNASSSSSTGAMQAPFNFAPLVTTRLGTDNYLYWRAQVAPILRSHLLTGFIDGTFPCPPQFIDNPAFNPTPAKDEALKPRHIPNPAFTAWHQQDAAILSAIISTSTEAVQGMILFANNSLDAWTTLASSFSSQSSARYMQLRRQIDEVKKLDSSVTVYFNKIKSLSDTLTSIGQPLRPEELISCILNGLDEDFDALVEVVSARTTPIPLRDLFSQLLSTEQRIARRKSTLHGGHGDFSANASYRNGGGKPSPPFRPDYRSGPDPRNLPRPVYITKPAGQGYTSGGGSRPGQGDRAGDHG